MQPTLTSPLELRRAALHWLAECDAARKAAGVRQLAQDWSTGKIELDSHSELQTELPVPGRPEKPELVAPRLVKRRSMVTPEGRAILIHALTHIEFNAINLALDAIWRFPGMPPAYYADWLRVADEEALHYSLLAGHLRVLGYSYGDFPAHSSLWEMADKTRSDILARIALVPRTMEARGLDVVPAIRDKLAQAGDREAAEIMDIILRDEIGHVAIGNRWYAYLCEQRGLEPVAAYAQLAGAYAAPVMRGPFNVEARRAAGFGEAELSALGS
ncbi:MAG: ferritin-like domain-containing protein [Nitrosomonadales bacterium]|nr:ferritin-like domain-containing protein [Nitrosomonadales bacterium]